MIRVKMVVTRTGQNGPNRAMRASAPVFGGVVTA
jgi:hypothetical protein